jgi:hypothetical protein
MSGAQETPPLDALDWMGLRDGAARAHISQREEKRGGVPDVILPHAQLGTRPLALDFGGSLIKLVYFVPSGDRCGCLHHEKFETTRVVDVVAFIARCRREGAQGSGAWQEIQPGREVRAQM